MTAEKCAPQTEYEQQCLCGQTKYTLFLKSRYFINAPPPRSLFLSTEIIYNRYQLACDLRACSSIIAHYSRSRSIGRSVKELVFSKSNLSNQIHARNGTELIASMSAASTSWNIFSLDSRRAHFEKNICSRKIEFFTCTNGEEVTC